MHDFRYTEELLSSIVSSLSVHGIFTTCTEVTLTDNEVGLQITVKGDHKDDFETGIHFALMYYGAKCKYFSTIDEGDTDVRIWMSCKWEVFQALAWMRKDISDEIISTFNDGTNYCQ